MRLDTWSPSRAEEAVAALADAFRDYPVMRHIIGEAGDDYARRLHLLIGLFVAGRVLRGNPILAIEPEHGGHVPLYQHLWVRDHEPRAWIGRSGDLDLLQKG